MDRPVLSIEMLQINTHYSYHIISYHIVDHERQNRLKVGTDKPKRCQVHNRNDANKHTHTTQYKLLVNASGNDVTRARWASGQPT